MSETNPEEAKSLLDSLIISDDDSPTVEGTPNPKANREPLRKRVRAASGTPKEAKPKERVAAQKKDEFVQPLTEMYTMLGVVLTPFDPVGPVIIQSAPNCAQSLNDLAAENESVRKALRSLTQASAMGAVIVAHAPIFISLATNHMPGALPRAMRPEPSEDDIRPED